MDFILTLKSFEQGASPSAHLDSLTEKGGEGSYSVATNVDVLTPDILTQGPGLATLENGDQTGIVSELINFILDKPPVSDVSFAIGNTKLFKLSPTTVVSGGTPSWPRTITGATGGNSLIEFQGSLYYFFNKASGGDCGKYDLALTFTDAYFSVVPTGAAALQSAPHPVAKKEDVMLFGNGRYVGTFISTGAILAATKLDFGVGTEVADVCFHANQWYIAVNSGITTGNNRASGQIYLYDGSATSSILADEVAVGVQKIGFIIPINGIIYVAYQDLSGSNIIGYVSGRRVIPLCFFTGTLPTFAAKTLYKNFLVFVSDGLIYAVGASIPDLPYSISQYMDGGFSATGGLACSFGTLLIASTESTSFKIVKASGYDKNATWKSIVIPTIAGSNLGMIDKIIVFTNVLASGASCSLTIESNQAVTTSSAHTITTIGKTRHIFKTSITDVQDFRVALSWSGGSAANPVKIRRIIVLGHYKEL